MEKEKRVRPYPPGMGRTYWTWRILGYVLPARVLVWLLRKSGEGS